MVMDSTDKFFAGAMILALSVGFIWLCMGTYDGVYVKPVAAERANQFCMDEGYDFYDSFSRVGILSKSPVAIKCKYVEQYRDIDVNWNKGAE